MDGKIRFLRSLPDPLGLFFRVGRNDHRILQDAIAEGKTSFAGLIFDHVHDKRHDELRQEALGANLDVVLDTRQVEMASAASSTRTCASLPWAGSLPHDPAALEGSRGTEIVKAIVNEVVGGQYTAVLGPGYHAKDATDVWLRINRIQTLRLRQELDRAQQQNIPIFFPLTIPMRVFRDKNQRAELKTIIKDLPIDSLWLRIDGFGARSAGRSLRAYIDACRDLHDLRIPLVAERSGTAGIALLAYGAVGGIESGITIGESMNYGAMSRPRVEKEGEDPKPFIQQRRIYVGDLLSFVSVKQAEDLMKSRPMKAALACKEQECCRKGLISTLENPKKHFLVSRQFEIDQLNRLPEHIRETYFLEDVVRPATDLAVRASRVSVDERTMKRVNSIRSHLESWRVVLGDLTRSTNHPTRSPTFKFRRNREGRRMQV